MVSEGFVPCPGGQALCASHRLWLSQLGLDKKGPVCRASKLFRMYVLFSEGWLLLFLFFFNFLPSLPFVLLLLLLLLLLVVVVAVVAVVVAAVFCCYGTGC